MGEDHAWAVNAGVLWDISPRWVVGASFRQGPQFEFSTSTFSGPRTGSIPIVAQPDNPFHVPEHSVSVSYIGSQTSGA